ncbi:thioesterase [Actinophytocola xinjiangensis]|uniref:Medium/long-chain acyl-CoA thioesterase YigI n=1 Tax=Actinophytocola xinjiangensis TaxID=485602 RepID=A0A7Z0WEY5_9PSEU|nr:PaaI family thioesterase [Actinophytocola xinjiangensis]OLF05257.1 thioesterase [Actinophytocola xinjiangensis]
MTEFHPTLELANSVLAAQPFTGQVGARCTVFDRGAATLEIDIRDQHRQQYGVVHGGVLAYAADNVLTFAGGSVLGPSVITAGFTINYLRAARDGVLRAEGVVVHANARQAVCTAQIRVIPPDGGEPTLCAVAQGTIVATGVSQP